MNLSIKRITAIAAILATGAAISTTANAAHRQATIAGNSTKTFTYRADPRELFRVTISGDGDTDLDLYIRDENGNLVCSRTGQTDDETCTVRASSYGGVYRIEVKNLNNLYNRTDIWVN